ncbi:MAG: hypothetical protein HY005_01855 [Candidatus Staskawiczbacteria bacterium]|nr:hypothetical protein [Candidatus Staskawiczbacteria bacterium]
MNKSKRLSVGSFLAPATMLVVVAIIWWLMSELQVMDDRYATYKQVEAEVYILGQSLARQSLNMAEPYMAVSYNKGHINQAQKLGELKYRVEKIYDSNRSWSEKESPFMVLRMISEEHAFGLFYENNPAEALFEVPANLPQVYNEARKNPRWAWAIEVEQKILKLEGLGSKVSGAGSIKELKKIRQEVESLVKGIDDVLKKGPPKPSQKSMVTISNPLVDEEGIEN